MKKCAFDAIDAKDVEGGQTTHSCDMITKKNVDHVLTHGRATAETINRDILAKVTLTERQKSNYTVR